MSDRALIRGIVTEEPQFVMNSNEERCLFGMAVETKDPKDGSIQFTHVRVITTPRLTPRFRSLLTKGEHLVILGDIGIKNGRLKMQAVDTDLPDFAVM